MTNPSEPDSPPSTLPQSAMQSASVRVRWRSWGVWGVVILAVAVFWPRRQRILLSNGSVLEVVQVTVGPRHSCPVPITTASIRSAIQRRRFRWQHYEVFADDNTVGLWFEKQKKAWNDSLYLVDRHGWRWAPLNRSRESPILFPSIDNGFPVDVEVVAGGSVYGRSRLAIPAGAPSRDDWEPDSFPVRQTSGPLKFELTGFELTVPDKIPSEASVRLKMEMTWNDHSFRPDFVSPSLIDSRRREDAPDIAPDGSFTTYLSPHDTLWQLQFLVGRDRGQPLDADEEITFEPDWESPEGVRVWDQTVAGVACRFAVSRSSDKISVPSLLPGAKIPWRALGTKVVAEPDHGTGASVRIDFLNLEGNVIHRGIVQELTIAGDRHRTSRASGANTGAVALPDRYRIRVGIDVPRPVMLNLDPRISR